MKKLIIILTLIFVFSFAGCTAVKSDEKKDDKNPSCVTESENQNAEAKEALQRVLENEQTFIAETRLFADETAECTLDKYHFQTYDNAHYVFVPEQYAFVDMDNDNTDELVILDAIMNYYLVLRYENQKVNGYRIDARSLIDLRTDGSFMISGGAGVNSIGNMCFEDGECKVVNKAFANDYDREYFIDDKQTDQTTFKEYFDDWYENTTAVSWQKINKQPTGLELDDGSTLFLQTDSIGNVEFKDESGEVLLDSADISVLYIKYMDDFGYYVQIDFTSVGSKKFANATRDNIGKILSVLADNEVISEPRVVDEITGGETIISGYESYEKAAEIYNKMKK